MQLMAAVSLTAHSLDTPTKAIKLKRHGLKITIEHPRGSLRILHDDDGNVVYKQHMHAHYGEFTNTKGRDGDPVDCFVGPYENAKEVYIIHMLDKGPVKAEREDEDKCFVSYQSPEAAKTAFLLHYPPSFYGGMTCLPIATFKKKLKTAQLPHREKKLHAVANRFLTIAEVKAYYRASEKKAKCPHCGSKKFNLMPTDYETAKCSNCHKNFQVGA